MPYVIALFSAMLMIYYALIKTNSFLLITINGIGCFIETVYIVLFLIFAPKKARVIVSPRPHPPPPRTAWAAAHCRGLSRQRALF